MMPYWISLLTISVLALMANIAEIIFLRKKNKTLHVRLLLSLCIADILSSFFYSISLFIILKKGNSFIFLFSSGTVNFMILSSWFHLAAIAVDRFISVTYPISYRIRASTPKMKIRVVVFVWSITIIVSALLWIIAVKLGIKNTRPLEIVFGVLIFMIGICLLAVYFLIIVRIIRQVKRRVSTEMNSLRKHLYNSSINNQEKSTIRNCALVTSSFILCTYPLAVDLLRGRPYLIPYLSGILLTLSRCLNPVIYFFANHMQRWYVYVSARHSSRVHSVEIQCILVRDRAHP